MSRILYAPLRAVALCAIWLCLLNRASADQEFMAADDDEEQVAAEEPAGDDLDSVLRRLDRAEAEIQRLSRPLSAPFERDTEGHEAQQDYGADIGPRNALTELQRRFDEMVAGVGKKTYPFVEVHGAVQMDNGVFGQDATNIKQVGVVQNGSDFRRTRLTANGGLTENMNYFVQMDFSFPGRPTFTDVWMEVQKLPILGNVRAGQWKQPFSLEVVSSFRYTTFAERSVLFQSFDPFRHIAIGFYDWTANEMMTWAGSLYRAGQDQFGDALSYANIGNYALVGRMTGLLWYEDDGCRYLHLGGAYNYVAPQNNPAFNSTTGVSSFGTIPEYFIGQNTTVTTGTAGVSQPTSSIDGTPRFVNTKNFAVDHYNLEGAELLWVEGPLSVQTEGMILTATRANQVGANFAGFYSTVGYFLTGEHRPYIKKSGAIDRIKVLNNFIKDSSGEGYGLGAWELAARWSYIDLNSKDIQGGRLFDFTAGLNWYLNSYAKVQFNYIRADLTNASFGSGIANIYGLRAQFDF